MREHYWWEWEWERPPPRPRGPEQAQGRDDL
jgi:hypothetical protein